MRTLALATIALLAMSSLCTIVKHYHYHFDSPRSLQAAGADCEAQCANISAWNFVEKKQCELKCQLGSYGNKLGGLGNLAGLGNAGEHGNTGGLSGLTSKLGNAGGLSGLTSKLGLNTPAGNAGLNGNAGFHRAHKTSQTEKFCEQQCDAAISWTSPLKRRKCKFECQKSAVKAKVGVFANGGIRPRRRMAKRF